MEQWDKLEIEAMEALDRKLKDGIAPPEHLKAKVEELEKILVVYSKDWISAKWTGVAKWMAAAKIAALVVSIAALTTVATVFYNKHTQAQVASLILKTPAMNSPLPADSAIYTNAPIYALDSPYAQGIVFKLPYNAKVPKQTFNEKDLSISTGANPFVETIPINGMQPDSSDYWISKNKKLQDYNALIPANAQHFVINNDMDTVLTCAGGLQVFIAAHSFALDSNDTDVTGNINIAITEFNSAYDLFANRLNTNCEKLIESGGSCYIEAKKGTAKLKLQKDKSIRLQFKRGKKGGFSTFVQAPNSDMFAWKLAQNEPNKKSDFFADNVIESKIKWWQRFKARINGFFYRGSTSFSVDVHPVPGASYGLDYNLMTNKYRNVKDYFLKFRALNNRLAYRMNKTGIDSVIVEYVINSNGIATDYFVGPIEEKSFKRKIKRNVRKYGKSKLLSQKQAGDGQKIYVVLRPNSINSAQNRLFNNFNDSLQGVMHGFENSILSNSLGFINCDRFYNQRTVQCKLSTPQNQGLMYLFIPNINALLQFTNGSYMGNLPANIEFNYIGLEETSAGLQMYIQENIPVGDYTLDVKPRPYDQKVVEQFFSK